MTCSVQLSLLQLIRHVLAADRFKLNSFINRCQKFSFCDKELNPSVTELFTEADDKLFSTTLNNIHHVLQTYQIELKLLTICVNAHTTKFIHQQNFSLEP